MSEVALYEVYHGESGFAGEDADAVLPFPISSQCPVKLFSTIMKELGHTYVDYRGTSLL